VVAEERVDFKGFRYPLLRVMGVHDIKEFQEDEQRVPPPFS
jgi:hypothetical protein